MPIGDSITVHVRPTRDDLKALARAYGRKMHYGARFATVLAAGGLFAVIALELPPFLMRRFALASDMASIVSWFLGFAFVLVAVSRLNRAFHRHRLDPRGTFLRGYDVSADGEGVSLTNEVMRTTYLWAAFLRMVETRTHYLLYVDGASAVVVPKRAFADENEAKRFAATLRLHITPAA